MQGFHVRSRTIFYKADAILMWALLMAVSSGVQRTFMHVRPNQYWRYRNAITYYNLCIRIVSQRYWPVNGAELARRVDTKTLSGPSYGVVLSILSLTGWLQLFVFAVTFPIGFRTSLATCVSWLLLNGKAARQQALCALESPALAPAVNLLCKLTHIFFGTIFLWSPGSVQREIDQCNPSWLISFAQLLAVFMVLFWSYITEHGLKVSFLRDLGMIGWKPCVTEQALIGVACAVVAYTVSFVFPLMWTG